ncbi:MAG: AAA family ATPase, partial [Actinobacteria bacterium]|nr:AAA family ATPase [Actinomycetota bacterium]
MTAPSVTMFGGVEVHGRSSSAVLNGTNLPGLLCLLATVPGRAVPNERLIGALWPDSDQVRAHHSLTSLVHQLNQTIDPVLGTTRTVRTVKGVGRALRIDPATIDTVMFERRVADGEAHAASGRHDAAVNELMSAIELWRGEPFAGLRLPALEDAAAQLATTRARAESILVDSALRVGRGGELLGLLETKVAAEPENEQAVAALARALCQLDRRPVAATVVNACIELLRRRGIEPTPQLRRVKVAIDTGRPIDAEHTSSPARVRSGPASFVGRHAERGVIGNWFVGASSARSRGRVLVITGDAGIGKTALLDAWLDGARDRVHIVRSHCSPEQMLPFEAFSPLLGRPVQGATGWEPNQPPIVRAISRLDELASERVTVLAIDDVQWMAPASVALLDDLVDQHDRALVIVTLRHHELERNEPLSELLERWRDERRVESLHLGPLTDLEMELLAASHLRGGSASSVRSHDLRALTGGNPLFVIQVAQSGAGGPDVVTTVEHLLGRYLDGLTVGARRSVETAALLGIGGTLGRLTRCTRRDELTEIAMLDTVGDGRLLDVSPAEGRYRFVHELARQTVTDRIPVGRSIRLHLAIADALEAETDPDVFALAHHLRHALPAAPAARVATALLAASRHARELSDFNASRTLAGQAFDAAVDGPTRADALVMMAAGAQSLGERDAASRYIAAALDLAVASNATQVLARALQVKQIVMASWGNHDLARRITESVHAWLFAETAHERPANDVELVE